MPALQTDRQTDGRTDGQQDDAISRSYCVAVRSAKNVDLQDNTTSPFTNTDIKQVKVSLNA